MPCTSCCLLASLRAQLYQLVIDERGTLVDRKLSEESPDSWRETCSNITLYVKSCMDCPGIEPGFPIVVTFTSVMQLGRVLWRLIMRYFHSYALYLFTLHLLHVIRKQDSKCWTKMPNPLYPISAKIHVHLRGNSLARANALFLIHDLWLEWLPYNYELSLIYFMEQSPSWEATWFYS
jgi:hypothetical protein